MPSSDQTAYIASLKVNFPFSIVSLSVSWFCLRLQSSEQRDITGFIIPAGHLLTNLSAHFWVKGQLSTHPWACKGSTSGSQGCTLMCKLAYWVGVIYLNRLPFHGQVSKLSPASEQIMELTNHTDVKRCHTMSTFWALACLLLERHTSSALTSDHPPASSLYSHENYLQNRPKR